MGHLFIAVVPDGLSDNPELKQLMSKFKRTMKDRDKEVRWVRPELWHVTLQFLGDLTPELEKAAEDFFASWAIPDSFRDLVLRFQGVGAFSSTEEARLLWIGIQKGQPLLDAQSRLSEALAEASLPTDERAYHPHLTLARFRNPMNASELVKLGGRKHFGDYKVQELILFESVLQGNMVKYIPRARRTLS